MDKHTIEGKWKELSGAAKEKWGELTDDEIQQVKRAFYYAEQAHDGQQRRSGP